MGIDDLPILDPAQGTLARMDVEAFKATDAPAFDVQRAQLKLDAALAKGLSAREQERLLGLLETPRPSELHRKAGWSWGSARSSMALASLAAAALVAGVWMASSVAPRDSLEWLAGEGDSPKKYELHDGSSILLEPGAQGRLLYTESGVSFTLDRGTAQFDVTKRAGQDWRVVAAQYEVGVVGTRFSVRFEPPDELDVVVTQGAVAVRGPSQGEELHVDAGSRLTALHGKITVQSDWRATTAYLREETNSPPTNEALPEALQGDDEGANKGSQQAAGAPSSALAPQASRTGKPDGDKGVTELKLLGGARRALSAGNPKAALALVRSHERRFPRGQLLEEREALRVEALRQMGQDREAQRAAREFRERFPKSVLSPQMPSERP